MKYIVTSALPYANGKLHVGHVAGAYLPADIFVRYLRLCGEDVIYICGTDEHGTPISISADREGISPNEVVQRYHDSIKEAFDGIGIEFDNFSGTARDDHYQLSRQFFSDLYENGHIKAKSTLQFYCEHDKRYLPDRYVEGSCPKCGATGARGDQCDKCGQIYDTTTLVDPLCKICGHTPIIRETKHWFIHLDRFTDQLKEWISHKDYWKENVRNFMLNLLEQGLIERSITRDLSWGVPVPLEEAEGKVLYVWFDAPIGYISSTVEWAKRIGKPELWKEYWMDPDTQLIHFIGKDNIIFHALIWPAMLMGQNKHYVLPHDIPANEFMNLEGEKISTSRNWAIWVDEFVKDFDGEYLRYYLAANAPEKQDADFGFKDFQLKINGELNNVLGNLANRVFAFANKQFGGAIEEVELDDMSLNYWAEAEPMFAEVKAAYKDYQVKRNTKSIMDIARLGNRYFDERKPWMAIKSDPDHVIQTMWLCARLLTGISVAMYPIMPKHMNRLRAMMGLRPVQNWDDYALRQGIQLQDVTALFCKIEDSQIETQLTKLHAMSQSGREKSYDPPKEQIGYDDFSKLDLRLAKILAATPVPKTDKLMQLKVDLGFEQRDLVAGIAQSYKAEDLVGKTVTMLINLEPRKIRGIVSNGMILAAHSEGRLSLVCPEGGEPGSTVQ
ncbi:MAG TPA: methionine--tRNA ligase [Candidatus Cloacimonadota bacterium]|nr:methionine--tRNA ligase [Candidatus Cloacimonadota bacterium]